MIVMHYNIGGRAHGLMMVERPIQHMMKGPGVWLARGVDIVR